MTPITNKEPKTVMTKGRLVTIALTVSVAIPPKAVEIAVNNAALKTTGSAYLYLMLTNTTFTFPN